MSQSWKKRKTWVLSQLTCGCRAWVIVGGHVPRILNDQLGGDLYCWAHSEERRRASPTIWRGFVASTQPEWTPDVD